MEAFESVTIKLETYEALLDKIKFLQNTLDGKADPNSDIEKDTITVSELNKAVINSVRKFGYKIIIKASAEEMIENRIRVETAALTGIILPLKEGE